MLAPSILSADFTNIRQEFCVMEKGGADFVHVDVMDGNYVPNISFGPGIIGQLRKLTQIPFDVHLMMEEPEKYVEDFARAGADIITIHPSTTKHLNRTIQLIHSYGIKAGVAVNPAESLSILDYVLDDVELVLIMSVNPGFGGQQFIPSALSKISQLRQNIQEKNLSVLIEVDGGVKRENIQEVKKAGADICVAGSAVFGAQDAAQEIRMLKELMK